MLLSLQVSIRCDVTGYPTPDVGIWMRDDPEADGGDPGDSGNIYDNDYYKNHVTIEGQLENSDVHYYVGPDGRNQTVYANIYLPSDVVKTKVFVCFADNGMSYPSLNPMYMQWQKPYEEAPWGYDRR